MKYKILAVDDDPQLTHFLETILTREGYEFEFASTARQGLWQAYAFQPDVVLLEVMLPDMDGWQALTALRTFSDVPVIMLTALVGTEEKIRSLDSGADDHVTKPFKVDELKSRIWAVLRRTLLQADQGRRRSWLVEPAPSFDLLARPAAAFGATSYLTPAEYVLLHSLALSAGHEPGSSSNFESEFWRTGYSVSVN